MTRNHAGPGGLDDDGDNRRDCRRTERQHADHHQGARGGAYDRGDGSRHVVRSSSGASRHGASSGIGRATALRLAEDGFHVFAGVRSDAAGEELRDAARPGCVSPLRLDVTDTVQISRAAASVEEHTAGTLDLLVNNAGIGVAEPVEAVDLQRLRKQLDVNVIGQVAVTQAVLDALRRARGTVIMIGSIGDRIAMPFAGPLVASKRALWGLTEALRMELRPWDVAVVLIEPASIRTAAVDKLEEDARGSLARMTGKARALYGTSFERMVEKAVLRERHGSPPEAVAAVISRAARSRRPRARYLVGADARRLALVARLPVGFTDLLLRRLFALPSPGSLATDRAVRR